MDAATITIVKDRGFLGHPRADMGNVGSQNATEEQARVLGSLPSVAGANSVDVAKLGECVFFEWTRPIPFAHDINSPDVYAEMEEWIVEMGIVPIKVA